MATSESAVTKCLYYEDIYRFQNDARVTAISEREVGGKLKKSILLDQTVMHPQGG